MAQNEAVFSVRITDNGTLQIVQKEAKKAAASLNSLGEAVDDVAAGQANFNRGQKGVIGATANGTKSFSKMRDAIGGSSGLVGAYATLAANVFALSAAFNALSRASKVDQLAKSIEFLSASSGDNLNRISKNLVEVTGNAISMADAMRSASFGTSAGFDSTQLETLAKVAKGASAALGRDLNDSFDRLTRGAAKLEPEILDELGIIVRIDKATQDYANAIGKNVKQLTAWERQQAFVNAINEQGIKKYGELADSIQVSPFDKLAAAATNASNASLKFVVEALKLPTLLNYIAENTTALAGVVIAFAGTITRQMLPAVYKIPDALARVADKAAIQSFEKLTTSLSGITGGLGPSAKKAVGDFVSKLEDGTASAEDLKATQDKLTRSLSTYNGKLKSATGDVEKLTKELKDLTAAEIKDTAAIAAKEQQLNEATAAQQKYTAAVATTKEAQTQVDSSLTAQNNALAKNKIASGVAAIGAWNFISGWKEVIQGVKGSIVPLSDATSAWGKFGIGAKNALTSVAAGVSAAFATVLTLISIIGVVTALFPGLQKWFMDSFFPEKESQKKAKALQEVSTKTQELMDHLQKVDAAIVIDVKADRLDSTVEALTRFTGVLREISAVIAATYEDLRAAFSKVIDEAGRADAQAQLIKIRLQKEELQQQAGTRRTLTGSTEGLAPEARSKGRGRASAPTRYSAETATLRRLEQEYADLLEKERKASEQVAKLSNLGLDMRLQEFGNVLLERATSLKNLEDSKVFNALGVSPKSKTEAQKSINETYSKIEEAIKKGQGEINSLLEKASKEKPESQARTDILKQADQRAQELQGQVNALTTGLRAPYESFVGEVNNVGDKVGAAGKALDTFAKKGEGRFAGLIEAFEGLTTSVNASELDSILSSLRGRGMKDALGTESIEGFLNMLRDASKQEARIPGLQIALENAKELTELFPNVISFEQKRVQAAKDLQAAEIAAQKGYITALEIGGASAETISAEREKLIALQSKGLQNETATLEVSKRIFQEEQNRARITQEIAQVTAQNAKTEQALANFRKTGRLDLTYAQQIENIKTEATLKKQNLQLEKTAQIASLEFEKTRFKLLLDRLILEGRISAEQAAEARTGLASIDAQIAAQNQLFQLKEKSIGLEADLQTAQLASKTAAPILTQSTSSILPEAGQSFDQQALVSGALEAGQAAFDAAKAQGLSDGLAKIKEGLTIANSAAQPFLASMRALGPEGEATAAVVQGAMAIGDAWAGVAAVFEKTSSSLERGAAIASAVGATIGSINQMLSANSNARISALDAEIAAEEKRDGKSKESLAKIAALEKKKEAEKKKAFEMNKKLMMAQTVANTAAAIMQALAQGGIYAIPIAAMFGVLGAAQLAIIASTSYQGGGASSAAAAEPSSLAVGQRTSSIDLAKSKSASGELAYLRGEQGMGGPEAFTPAFTGMKYRAAGGATTGFMVGEQGPELFIPDRPGTIVPADETAGVGGVTNVSFSISAIDTQGMEDMLENQKGTIINMIRQAANSYGQPFIEQVDTSVYRPSRSARTYRR